MTALNHVIDHNISQILEPRTIQNINIKDIIYYLSNTENILNKINLKPHIYILNDLKGSKDLGVISRNDITGKVMLRLLRYVVSPEYFYSDKKKYEYEIKSTNNISNIENFINYISLNENSIKTDLYDSLDDNENKINISDVDIWTLKRLSNVLT